MTVGRIHSIESMGLVDGPGIRTVVFFQGCRLRCAYCHNPDTWNLTGGTEITVEDLMKKIRRFKPYFQRSGGGVTFSGGDPLLQPDFLIALLQKCKEEGIHTAVDTAGVGVGKYDEILKYADLVILDIKHINNEGYKELTGQGNSEVYKFLKCLEDSGVKIWIRHVVVPGMTDSEPHMEKLADIIAKIKHVEKVELLSYHTLALSKYDKMDIPYRLKGIPAMDKALTEQLEKELLEKIDKIKNENDTIK